MKGIYQPENLDMTEKIEFFTLPALASKEGVGHDYLRKLTAGFRKTGENTWRNWRFYSIGSTHRSCWLAYDGGHDIVINDTIETESI